MLTPTFAERLDTIIRASTDSDGHPWSHRSIGAAVEARGWPPISQGYLSQLRTGIKDNPTLHHILALADVFGVDPSYFVSPTPSPDVIALHQAAATHRREVVELAARAAQLGSRGLEAVRAVVEAVQSSRES